MPCLEKMLIVAWESTIRTPGFWQSDTVCATNYLGFSRESNKNQTQFRVGPCWTLPHRRSTLLVLDLSLGVLGTQKSSDKSCFVIHRKDVNAPNHRENAKTIAHGGGSQCRLRVRAKVTQNPTSYKLPFKKGRPCPQPHKATDNWCSKVLGFFYQLHEMRIVGLHSQRVLGFRCSKMFKVTSLDSKKTWIPRCRRPLALEPKQPQII